MRLHTKLALLIVFLVAVTGGTAVLLVSNAMRDALERELEKKGVVIAQALVEGVVHNVIDGEVIAARQSLRETVRRTEDVEFAYVVGFDGNVFAHSFEDGFPRALLPDEHEIIRAEAPHLEKYSIREGMGMLIVYPLIDGMKACLHIGLSETNAHDQIERARNQIVVAALVIGLVTALFSIVLSRAITSPLGRLSASLRAFGEGQADQELDYRGGGREVADLTRSFNQMIAERKQTEEALRQSEETYRTLVTACPDAVTAADLEGNITYASERALDLLGYGDAEELLGKSAFELIDPADREEALKNLQKTLKEGVVREAQYTMLRSDGTRFAVEVSAGLIRDAEGRPSGFVAIARDITERRVLEEQFRQAQKMEAVGQLAGGVAHDFNNILTAIMGYADFLAKDIDFDDPRRADVEGIREAAKRAAILVRQLLAFSRRQVLKPRVVNLNDVIADVTKMLRRLIGEDSSWSPCPRPVLAGSWLTPGRWSR